MEVILTNRKSIKSKAGQAFSIYGGLSASGSTVQVFLTPEQEVKYGINDSHVMSKEELTDLFEKATTVDVEFNERGRVDSVIV